MKIPTKSNKRILFLHVLVFICVSSFDVSWQVYPELWIWLLKIMHRCCEQFHLGTISCVYCCPVNGDLLVESFSCNRMQDISNSGVKALARRDKVLDKGNRKGHSNFKPVYLKLL